MENSILSLSAEGYWLASVFCTKMMFCHLGKELISTSPQRLVKQGNLEMSMSLWHQHVIIPTNRFVTHHHKIPTFAQTALQERNVLDSRNCAVALHVCLLLHASREIMAQCRENNVGRKTLEEVNKWFVLMSETANSALFEAAPDRFKTEFQELLQDDLPNEENSMGKQEYPYFRHEILFLRIAHMIFFYCRNNIESGFSNSRHASIQANDIDMTNWEELSGELFQHTFSLDRTSPDIDHFAFLQLPYEKLVACIDNSDSPSAAHMHVNVLHAIHDVVQRNLRNSLHSDWETEAPLLELFMPFAKTQFDEKYKPMFFNRKKQRTHYMKNRNQAKAYKKKQRYLFQRDKFIMGCESCYWKNRSPSGRAMGEFQFVYPQLEENLAVEENDEEGENTESDGDPF
jgi:hypothetical protein